MADSNSSRESAPTSGTSGPTHVVTCFLMRTDRERDEVLLVRRSERVRTYRGAWAGISGYVEPGIEPLEQAYTELREEAGMARDDLRLVRTGGPVAFTDPAVGQAWVVHPFLFAAERPDALTMDWEASAHQWVTPDALAGLPTVPMLVEALATVYPPGGAHDG